MLAAPLAAAMLRSGFMGGAYGFLILRSRTIGGDRAEEASLVGSNDGALGKRLVAGIANLADSVLGLFGLVGVVGSREVLGDADAAGPGHLRGNLLGEHRFPHVAG